VPARPLKRVLLVEDDPDVRAVVCLCLEQLGGLTLLACGSAHEALERARAFAPDLIVLDVMMEGMSGPDALAALRARPDTRGVPVVFLTARTTPGEVQGYERLGCLGVIPKPFEPALLPEQLQALWERPR
jgi:CheY-like chemotaxis protein